MAAAVAPIPQMGGLVSETEHSAQDRREPGDNSGAGESGVDSRKKRALAHQEGFGAGHIQHRMGKDHRIQEKNQGGAAGNFRHSRRNDMKNKALRRTTTPFRYITIKRYR